MADTFTSSLVGKTNPSPYNQAIILSQIMIDNAFYNMWLLADDDSPLRKFKKKLKGSDESIDVKLAAPTIQLQVTTIDPQLYFMLNIKSGSVTLYASDDDDDDTTDTWDTTDWVVAFSVKIGTVAMSITYTDVIL
jgi:hypothetical protein